MVLIQSAAQKACDYKHSIIEAPARPAHVKDIDAEDAGNPQLVSEYINEIYVYLRRLEREQAVRRDYMNGVCTLLSAAPHDPKSNLVFNG